MPKECSEDKILNPETGRCVKKDGRIGKQILKKKTEEKKKKKKPEDEPVVKKSKHCLDDLKDYSKFSKRIVSVTGKSASSSSLSDIYVLKLDDNRDGYMKVFSMDDDLAHRNAKYEFFVYTLKIKFLSLISPNFVTPIAGKLNSDFKEIIDYLEGRVKDEKTKNVLPRDDLIQRFHRNITLSNISEMKKIPKRPSIETELFTNKYGYIVTGPSINDINKEFNKVTSLRSFIDNNYKLYEDNVWEIICQIAVACYLMNLSDLVHNDLHSDNILVYAYKNPRNIQYNLGTKNKPYYIRISTPYVIKIFDFDRSNMRIEKSRNDNSFTSSMIASGQDNLFIEMKDLVKSLCYLPETKTFNKAKLLLRSLAHFSEYKRLLDKDCFYTRNNKSDTYWANEFRIFDSLDTVMRKIKQEVKRVSESKMMEIYDLYSDVVTEDISAYHYDLVKICDANLTTTNPSFLNM